MCQTRKIYSALFILIALFATMDGMFGFRLNVIIEGTTNRVGRAMLQPPVKLVRKARSPTDHMDTFGLYNDIEQNQLRYKRLGYQNAFEVMDALEKNVKSGGLVHPV